MNKPHTQSTDDILNIGRQTLNSLLASGQLVTLYNWSSACNISDSYLTELGKTHSEINELIKEFKVAQEHQLESNGLSGKFNSIMSIFLLKAKHGYMETDKRILTGDKDNPVTIKVIQDTTLGNIEDTVTE